MVDELEAFVDTEASGAAAAERAPTVRDLLVFDCDGDLFAVPATAVDAVVPWKAPAPVPGADARVRGVIQDRGRIVVLLNHPSGRSDREAPGNTKRIVICTTPRGLVGLPASATRSVGAVELATEPLGARYP